MVTNSGATPWDLSQDLGTFDLTLGPWDFLRGPWGLGLFSKNLSAILEKMQRKVAIFIKTSVKMPTCEGKKQKKRSSSVLEAKKVTERRADEQKKGHHLF